MVSKDDIIAKLKQLVEKQAEQILALMANMGTHRTHHFIVS